VSRGAELVELTAAEIAAAVRRGAVSPVEVVSAHLARLEGVNPALNAVVTVCADAALAQARALERAPLGALAGVPFTVKDVIATAGVRTTCGSTVLAGHVPAEDAPAVARMRRAGAILLGKANCAEFALGGHTDNPLFGETGNPLGAVSPGGSSGGDAAAVAAGIAPLALASDFGGSLRWPVHCTGIAALRPTPGLVPSAGELPPRAATTLQARIGVLGPMARSVADLRRAFAVLAGRDHAAPGFADDTRIAWCAGDGVTPVRADVVAAGERAAGFVAAQPAAPEVLGRANDVFSRLRRLDGLRGLRDVVAGREDELGAPLRALLAETRDGTSSELGELWRKRRSIRAEFLRFLDEFPILLMPVATVTAYDPRTGPVVDGREQSMWDVVAPCRAISVFGVPSAAVTIGRGDDGLPVAVQVVGRPLHEGEVLAVAAALEEATR
jgi:amidase